MPIPVLVIVEGLSTLSMNNLRRTLSEIRYVNTPIAMPVKRLLTGNNTHKTAAKKPNPTLIQ